MILADPVPRHISQSDNFALSSNYIDLESSENELARIIPDTTTLLLKVIKAIVGYKVSAISLAVGAIGWIVSNSVVIAIGSIVAIGFCKLTGKCSLSYEEYIPVAQLRSYVTPEHLKTAETFLVSALEKYAESNK
ncbi:uncharacterized protein LOC131851939 [Achroia grisella]|uniref:uncharacterized protein LOC131851939 n=1 Tax=Achroia grisella TaxID=688607 RepID=UPI0027D238A6|nr:uncharacterized protein LOC131851939 [Achroia grisella]